MNNIIVKQISIDHPDYLQVYELREEVLRKPIGLSLKDEDLSGDRLDIILAAYNNDKVVGCVMIHPTAEITVRKLRQMGVADSWRGKGVGKLLVTAAEGVLKLQGIKKIILHARITAEGFYKGLGYTITSDIFTEVGIPHVVMGKEL